MQSDGQLQLAKMIKGQMFEGFLLVKSAEQRTSSNGSKFLDMTLGDVSGDVNAKMWDGATPAPKVSSVIRVRGMMLEYNNRPQLRVDKMRETVPADKVDMSLLIPCAPYPAEEMISQIDGRIAQIQDEELRRLVAFRVDECREKLMYFPAAKQLHHAERAGLLHHTTTMLRGAAAICEIYPSLNADLLAAGVILHDLSKLSELNSDEMGLVSEYTAEGQLLGHLVKGVCELARAGEKLGVRQELLMLMEHMILSHHDLPEFGSPRRPMFPEAEVLHTLDLLDARMFEMERSLSAVAPGAFTEKIWSLERRLYKPKLK